MSQVLIGIIGVILFIGLALAGAMFLGPQFQKTSSTSRASAHLQAAAQIAHAADLYRAQEGVFATNPSNLIARGYLKNVPVNPTAPVYHPTMMDRFNAVGVETTPTDGQPEFVYFRVGNNKNDRGNQEVCKEINVQSGAPATIPMTAPGLTTPNGVSGCFDNGSSLQAWTRL
ncbi:hypothetical protein [Erythrobacter aureus]|uniref:Type II secretion system protein n=1 Tax=Erythrobacter aureus TaxID=2182384 RepID=A0A345YJK9_9SPHN|nr:hypothetical protein [Erythrobacter aureus]AXK44111.1 hypothetical protein DVR09_16800 [Erythrobacter aureus]